MKHDEIDGVWLNKKKNATKLHFVDIKSTYNFYRLLIIVPGIMLKTSSQAYTVSTPLKVRKVDLKG